MRLTREKQTTASNSFPLWESVTEGGVTQQNNNKRTTTTTTTATTRRSVNGESAGGTYIAAERNGD
jgi:hypothetical protein